MRRIYGLRSTRSRSESFSISQSALASYRYPWEPGPSPKFQNTIVDSTRGSSLPLANFPVSINIGPLSTEAELPGSARSTAIELSNHQLKYDGSKTFARHILRYGMSFNHI